jgi:hypothetical protein
MNLSMADRPLSGGNAAADFTPNASAGPMDQSAVIEEAKSRCFDYVFNQQVVNRAFIRMIVYAKYGPGVRQQDGTVRLTGAHRVLHPFEEKELLAEEQDILITDIYGGTLSSTALTGTQAAVDDESRGAMNRTKNPLALDAMRMTRAELTQVLAQTPSFIGANSKHRSFDGSGFAETVKTRRMVLDEAARSAKSTPSDMATLVSGSKGASTASAAIVEGTVGRKDRFPAAVEDALSTSLLAERRRRIAALKRSVPNREEVRSDVDVTQKAVRHFYNRTAPKAYELRTWEDPKDILRGLHRYASAIVDPSVRTNNASVTLNVRCLRKDFIPDPTKPGWDGYCCVRQQNPSVISTMR